MTKTILIVLLLAALLATVPGCVVGPNKITRAFDDWVNEKYTENAWLHGALLQQIIPVYPIAGAFAALGDILALNFYYFWGDDAWDNRGTGFIHDQIPDDAKSVAW